MEILIANTSVSNHEHSMAITVENNLSKERAINTVSETLWINISIENSTFINNKVAVKILVGSNINLRFDIVITYSAFYGNGKAIDFKSKLFPSQTFVYLRNVTLANNSPHIFLSGVIHLFNVDMLDVKDCRIINNQGTSIESYYSGVTLAGNTLFSNNTGMKGGALLLYESYLYLGRFSNISFINSYAKEIGGAIYLKQRSYFQLNILDYPPCFYQINSIIHVHSPELNFKGNLASRGGNDIYGGSLHVGI